jgi:hypothetical protein
MERLRQGLQEGSVQPDHLLREFERLAFSLTGVGKEQDRALRDLANEIERIRFGYLPTDQVAAMVAVVERAQALVVGLH